MSPLVARASAKPRYGTTSTGRSDDTVALPGPLPGDNRGLLRIEVDQPRAHAVRSHGKERTRQGRLTDPTLLRDERNDDQHGGRLLTTAAKVSSITIDGVLVP